MGYYGVFLGLQYRNARQLIKKFDEGAYDLKQTQILKIPFKSPSLAGSETFERMDGDFERHGEVYRIIKSRLFRDTFHIVYMKDKTSTALNKALSDYVRTFIEESPGRAHVAVMPLFIKEYFSETISMKQLSTGWEHAVRKESHSIIFIEAFTSSIIHPPERG